MEHEFSSISCRHSHMDMEAHGSPNFFREKLELNLRQQIPDMNNSAAEGSQIAEGSPEAGDGSSPRGV